MNEFNVRVVIADDHPIVLCGLRQELLKNPIIELVGEAQNSTHLVKLLDEHPVDVAIVDYSMREGEYGDGIALFSFLRRRYARLRFVALMMSRDPNVIGSLLANGVSCILSKSDAISHLIAGIYAAQANGRYLSPTVETIVNSLDMYPVPTRAIRSLTVREIGVVRLYRSGMTINEIADKLGRSKQTISAQKMSAMRKLGIARNVDLIKYPIDPQPSKTDTELGS